MSGGILASDPCFLTLVCMMKGYVGGCSVWIDGMGCLHIGTSRGFGLAVRERGGSGSSMMGFVSFTV